MFLNFSPKLQIRISFLYFIVITRIFVIKTLQFWSFVFKNRKKFYPLAQMSKMSFSLGGKCLGSFCWPKLFTFIAVKKIIPPDLRIVRKIIPQWSRKGFDYAPRRTGGSSNNQNKKRAQTASSPTPFAPFSFPNL